MQFVIVEKASKQFYGQWAVSYLGIIGPVGLPKDCWGYGSYYGAQRRGCSLGLLTDLKKC